MRYYYYGEDTGSEQGKKAEQVTGYQVNNPALQDMDLVIDEDTIYEIDRDCIRCKEKQRSL